MFDVLTYQKGAGVLRMLERYLGAERFRDGVRRYLESHRFGNTETADLWDAIEAASGEPVRDIMDTWILQGGFPLVTVDGSGPGGAPTLTQAPFRYAPAPGPERHRLGVDGAGHRQDDRGHGDARALLADAPETLDLEDGPDAAIVVNAGGSGFYRVRYAPELHRRLADAPGRPRTSWNASTCSATPGPSWSPSSPASTTSSPGRGARRRGGPRRLGPGHRGAGASSTAPSTTTTRPLVAAYTRALLSPVLARLGWDGRRRRGPPHPHPAGPDLRHAGHGRRRHRCPGRGAADASTPPSAARPRSTPTWPRPSSPWWRPRAGPSDYERLPRALPAPRHPPGGDPLPLRPGRLHRPALAARTFELARTEVRTQDAPFVIQLLLANRDNGPADWAAGPGPLGRAAGPLPRQHPAPHARAA